MLIILEKNGFEIATEEPCVLKRSKFIRFIRILRWFPLLIWYRVIWGFSDQTAAVSGDVSDRFLHRILAGVSPAYVQSEEYLQVATVEVLSFFERKAAHMFLYFILMMFLLMAFGAFVRGSFKHAIVAGLFCAGFAALDEFHQTFIPGRSGSLQDVVVDMAGALIVCGLWLLLRWTGVVQKREEGLLQFLVWMPIGIGLLSIYILPLIVQAPLSFPVYADLSQRFWEDWDLLSTAQQTIALKEIAAIMGEIFYVGASGLLGVLTVLTLSLRRRTLMQSLAGAIPISLIIAILAGLLYHCCVMSGMIVVLMGVFAGISIWAVCILVKKRENAIHSF